ADDLRVMDAALFADAPFGLKLTARPPRSIAEARHG
ncbi:MAG: hypothetical protein K0S42_2641, partial [Microvirga sp.]|nr:hypothetical protein [Microvirga sp.]